MGSALSFLVSRLLWDAFVLSSLFVVNVIFLGTTLFILPFSRLRYRQFNEIFTKALWPMYAFGLEVVGRNKLIFTGDSLPLGENVLLITNHSYWCDWIVGIAFATRVGAVGHVKLMAKELIRWIPAVGTSLMAVGCIFLSRNWQTDAPRFRRRCAPLLVDPLPFWLLSHPEGSRVTPQKLAESHKFAKERNLPILNHLLLPRVKGFQTSLSCLRPKLHAVYDLTIKYTRRPPVVWKLLNGLDPITIHVHVKRYPVASIPQDDAGSAAWLYECYRAKDEVLEYYSKNGRFPGPEVPQLQRLDVAPIIRTILWWAPLVLAVLALLFVARRLR